MEAARVYKDLIWQDPDRVSGAICFYGTRIPVQHLLDYLNASQTIEEFCAAYNVDLNQARGVLALNAIDGFLEAA